MNVHLFYHGGSGGFYSLWHILLCTSYECSFIFDKKSKDWAKNKYSAIRGDGWPATCPKQIADFSSDTRNEIDINGWVETFETMINIEGSPTLTLEEIYGSHWNISNQGSWKTTEVWPNNVVTNYGDYKNKIFFTCNPTNLDIEKSKADLNILLYTDIKTQTAMASAKNAWVFFNNQIKDTDTETSILNGDEVYYKVYEHHNLVHHTIKLQDIVKSQGQALMSLLGATITEKNKAHNNMWLNLHTTEQISLLLS